MIRRRILYVTDLVDAKTWAPNCCNFGPGLQDSGIFASKLRCLDACQYNKLSVDVRHRHLDQKRIYVRSIVPCPQPRKNQRQIQSLKLLFFRDHYSMFSEQKFDKTKTNSNFFFKIIMFWGQKMIKPRRI